METGEVDEAAVAHRERIYTVAAIEARSGGLELLAKQLERRSAAEQEERRLATEEELYQMDQAAAAEVHPIDLNLVTQSMNKHVGSCARTVVTSSHSTIHAALLHHCRK
eukprot:SAG31_NODE_8390_length_1460_cov_1.714181_3_plen_109_part_00